MDTGVLDDILDDGMDIRYNGDTTYMSPPLGSILTLKTAAREVDMDDTSPATKGGVTNTLTNIQIFRHGIPYDPSVSLTPLGFKGNKNLTISKMSLYPRYYDRLRAILPNSVFNPKHDEGITKETVCLGLVIDAHHQGMSNLLENLQNTLHFEL